jgi:nitrite reductase (cytochrome c-552)
MPYTRVGAMKISDHHVRSPLLNINNACQTCHKVPEDELLFRAERIQQKNHEMRDISLTALSEYIGAIKAAQLSGVDEAVLERARDYHRKASFFIDYVEAENSMGFHAPQEAARVLFKAMDYLRLGQKTLTEDPRAAGIPMPELPAAETLGGADPEPAPLPAATPAAI